MQNVLWFVVAAACEIAGCYTAWMWLRLGRSAWWLAPGTVSLIVFALALARVDAAVAGRAFAAYGGIYIASSLVWMALVERTAPRITDYIGAPSASRVRRSSCTARGGPLHNSSTQCPRSSSPCAVMLPVL